MDYIEIERMVESFEGSLEIGAITDGARDEVGEAGNGVGRRRGDGELRFYKKGMVGRWRGVRGEGKERGIRRTKERNRREEGDEEENRGEEKRGG